MDTGEEQERRPARREQHMRSNRLWTVAAALTTTLVCFTALAAGQAPGPPEGAAPSPALAVSERIDGIVRAFDAAVAKDIWPGFDAKAWPLAVFDGERTILLRHPSAPPEFTAVPGRPGVLVFPGRFPAVTGNSTRDIGGVRTATVVATTAEEVESALLAAVEEVFHVFWLSRHTGFRPNEMARYGYPLTDVDNLRLILAEDEALARALAADAAAAAAWAGAAIRSRRERTPRLEPEVLAYETALEMMEGTANFAARFALGENPEKTSERLRAKRPAEAIRWRFYDTGAAVCMLLERLQPGWKVRLDTELDLTILALLDAAVSRLGVKPAEFSAAEAAELRASAEGEVTALAERRGQLRKEVLERPGARVVIEAAAGAEPFALPRFDPINLSVLDGGEVVHANFLNLSSASGTVELANPGFARRSFAGTVGLTVPAGRHPLGTGIRALTVVGIQGEPKVGRDGDTVTVEAPGLRVTLKGASVRTENGTTHVVVPAPPQREE
jgi:hypothetical protein